MATTTAPPRAGRREWIGLAVLALACLLYAMDLTVLHLAVPEISAQLRPSSAQLLWIIDIYGFMVAGFLVTMGTLGDRVGRRRLLLIGAAGFGLMSLLAAFAPTAETLIASRALLGVAGATVAPSTMSLIFTMFRDARQRSVAIGVWIGAFSAGGAVGPLLGGVLLESFWWGSVFLLAVPVMVLLLMLGPIVLPEYRDRDAGRLDPASVVLSLTAVLGVIYGVKQIAQDGPGPLAVGAIVAGLALAGGFVLRQLRLADPMIDLRLLRVPAFSASVVVNVVAVLVVFGYFLFVTQYLQLVSGMTPLRAGLWSLPSAAAFVVGSQLAPRLVRGIRPAYVIAGSLGLSAAGLLVLTQVDASGGVAALVVASVVISLGLAPVFGLTTELVVGAVPPERAGAASGIAETGSEFGGAIGISIFGSMGVAVYRSEVADALPADVPPAAAASILDTLGAAVVTAPTLPEPLGGTVLAAAREAFVHGIQLVALVAAGIALVLAVVAVLTLRRIAPAADGDTVPAPAGEGYEVSVADRTDGDRPVLVSAGVS